MKKTQNMAKDDYFTISYKILLYLYGVLKRKVVFDEQIFKSSLKVKDLSEEYFETILQMLQDEGYIKGLLFAEAWGSEVILTGSLSDAKITQKGIEYIENDSIMNMIKDELIKKGDRFASLIKLVL